MLGAKQRPLKVAVSLPRLRGHKISCIHLCPVRLMMVLICSLLICQVLTAHLSRQNQGGQKDTGVHQAQHGLGGELKADLHLGKFTEQSCAQAVLSYTCLHNSLFLLA